MAEQVAKREGKEEELSWHMRVEDMSHEKGFKYPVFEWSRVAKDGARGGELRAWPLRETLVFETRRGEGPFTFYSVRDAQAKIDKHGWGAVPHLAEVFQLLQKTSNKFPAKDITEAKEILSELKKKWLALIPEE